MKSPNLNQTSTFPKGFKAQSCEEIAKRKNDETDVDLWQYRTCEFYIKNASKCRENPQKTTSVPSIRFVATNPQRTPPSC
jgi:hypothetical protein